MTDRVIVAGPPGSMTFGMPGSEWLIDPSYGAGRVRLMPSEYNNPGGAFQGGFFRVARSITGLTGLAAGAPIVSFRWAPSSGGEVLIKKIAITAIITTAFTAAQAIDFDVIKAQNFTASDTGGNAITPIAAANQRLRTKWMNNSQVTDFRDSSGAALTAGTRTLDAQPFGYAGIVQTNALGSGGALQDLYKHDIMAGHPDMLENNEGFIIRNVTALGAVGIIKVGYIVEWGEVPGL